MPSDKNTRRQRHQAAVKPQRGKAIRGAQATEFVKKAGYRKSEFIGGKKYYTPMSTDPTSSGAGGDVTNVTISGSSGVGTAVDNIGVYNITTVAPVLGGHVTPITGSGVISIQDYDPIGAAASGLSAKGVISSDTVYDGDSPGTFATHFLRKDGVWADVSASLNAFVTWSWTGNINNNTPFTTVADSSADGITITAGDGIQFTDGSSNDRATDALTISSTVPDLTANGAGTVHSSNYSVPYYTSAISNATSSARGLAHEPHYTSAIADYDPVGGEHRGLTYTSDTYSGGNPSANNFTSYYLRKDGAWSNPLGSVLTFKTISVVPASNTPFSMVADATDDTVTLTAGSNVEFTAGSGDAMTISATNTTYSVGDGGLTQNNFTNSDHTKLNGIEASADVTDSTNVNAAGAIMHTDLAGNSTGFMVRNGAASYTIDTNVYLQTGANTLSDDTNSPQYMGIYHSANASELKFYTLKAGDNIVLSKNNAGGQANTYIEISATDAPTANRFTGILDDGVTTYTAAGATDTLKIAGGTGVNTSAGQNGNTVTVTLAIDIGTGSSQAAAGDHTHTAANVGLGTSADVQFDSFGVGTAASSTTGEIRATNEVTAYYSDDRLKTKHGNIEKALEKVCSLNGFHYQPNELAGDLGYNMDEKKVGVSAQEVLKVLPEAVTNAPIDPQYHTVQYEKLVPLLIEAIKELNGRKCSCGSK